MSSKQQLKLDWCSHSASKFAVTRWHYSKSLPPPPMVHIGVWECGDFIGCVLFSRGASSHLLTQYGLQQTEGCELTRIALASHNAPVTRIVSVATRMLKQQSPGLRLIVSFADPYQEHIGSIYQAGNWVYTGKSGSSTEYLGPDGKVWHARMVKRDGIAKVFGKRCRVLKTSDCTPIKKPGKHRYLMPLDNDMRQQIEPLRRPYPKCVRSDTGDTPSVQDGKGGSIPTRTLSMISAPVSSAPLSDTAAHPHE